MKLTVNKSYTFRFAGQDLKGKFLKESTLHSGDVVYKMMYNNCIYPVKYEDITK